jgi:hypothetical protein
MIIFFKDMKNSITREKHTIVKNTTHDSIGIAFKSNFGLIVKNADSPMLAIGSIT